MAGRSERCVGCGHRRRDHLWCNSEFTIRENKLLYNPKKVEMPNKKYNKLDKFIWKELTKREPRTHCHGCDYPNECQMFKKDESLETFIIKERKKYARDARS